MMIVVKDEIIINNIMLIINLPLSGIKTENKVCLDLLI